MYIITPQEFWSTALDTNDWQIFRANEVFLASWFTLENSVFFKVHETDDVERTPNHYHETMVTGSYGAWGENEKWNKAVPLLFLDPLRYLQVLVYFLCWVFWPLVWPHWPLVSWFQVEPRQFPSVPKFPRAIHCEQKIPAWIKFKINSFLRLWPNKSPPIA